MTDFTKAELRILHARSVMLGSGLLVCDLIGYVVTVGLVVYVRSAGLQSFFSALEVFFIGRLFMLGHDACHQSLTPNRRLNRSLGVVAFLPSLHPYSLWDLGHNRIHHRYTNQRDLDYVWEPLDPREYAQLSRIARFRYRLFRTPVGHLAYYGTQIWWRKMFFPRPSAVGGYRREFVWDHVAVTAWAVLSPAVLLALRLHWFPQASWSDLAITLFWTSIMPLIGFNAIMSSLIYLHHTHPSVAWTRGESPSAKAQVAATVHVILPAFVEHGLHRIMDHPAHHARPGIPSYRLAQAQILVEASDVSSIVERWTPAFHIDTLRRCKLFHLERRCWVGFDGAPSNERPSA